MILNLTSTINDLLLVFKRSVHAFLGILVVGGLLGFLYLRYLLHPEPAEGGPPIATDCIHTDPKDKSSPCVKPHARTKAPAPPAPSVAPVSPPPPKEVVSPPPVVQPKMEVARAIERETEDLAGTETVQASGPDDKEAGVLSADVSDSSGKNSYSLSHPKVGAGIFYDSSQFTDHSYLSNTAANKQQQLLLISWMEFVLHKGHASTEAIANGRVKVEVAPVRSADGNLPWDYRGEVGLLKKGFLFSDLNFGGALSYARFSGMGTNSRASAVARSTSLVSVGPSFSYARPLGNKTIGLDGFFGYVPWSTSANADGPGDLRYKGVEWRGDLWVMFEKKFTLDLGFRSQSLKKDNSKLKADQFLLGFTYLF